LVATLVAAASFGAPAASAAQTVGVSVAPASPIDGTATTVTVTGSSDTGGSVYVALDSAGATCGSNPSNDPGSAVISGDSVGGPTYTDVGTLTPAEGSYVLCAWLMPTGDDGSGVPLAGPSSTPLTVQPLQATVTLTAPVSVSYQQPIPVTIDWQADATGSVLVDILPASYGPCTADPADEPQYIGWLSGQDGYTNNDPIGQDATSGTNQYLAGEFAAGTYQLCAWAEEPSGSVVAGPVSLDVQMLTLPGSRIYSGRTTQHLPLAITATGYTIQDIIYSARFKCGAPEYFSTGLRWNGIWNNTVLTVANFGTIKLLNGRFGANLDANPSNRFNIRGSVTDATLSGTLNAVMRVGPPQFTHPATCRTGNVRFAIDIHTPKRRHRRH
jgi:hypothetical protein